MSSDTDDVRVVLRVDHRLNDPEQHCLAVLGSSVELGCWKPEKAIRAEYMGRSTWQAVVKLAPNQSLVWKWVVIDVNSSEILEWESGQDKTIEIRDKPLMGVNEWGKPVEVTDIFSESSVRLFHGVHDLGDSPLSRQRYRTQEHSTERRQSSNEKQKQLTERKRQSNERRKRSTERSDRGKGGKGKKLKRIQSKTKMTDDSKDKRRNIKCQDNSSSKDKIHSETDMNVFDYARNYVNTCDTDVNSKFANSETQVKVKQSNGLKAFFLRKLRSQTRKPKPVKRKIFSTKSKQENKMIPLQESETILLCSSNVDTQFIAGVKRETNTLNKDSAKHNELSTNILKSILVDYEVDNENDKERDEEETIQLSDPSLKKYMPRQTLEISGKSELEAEYFTTSATENTESVGQVPSMSLIADSNDTFDKGFEAMTPLIEMNLKDYDLISSASDSLIPLEKTAQNLLRNKNNDSLFGQQTVMIRGTDKTNIETDLETASPVRVFNTAAGGFGNISDERNTNKITATRKNDNMFVEINAESSQVSVDSSKMVEYTAVSSKLITAFAENGIDSIPDNITENKNTVITHVLENNPVDSKETSKIICNILGQLDSSSSEDMENTNFKTATDKTIHCAKHLKGTSNKVKENSWAQRDISQSSYRSKHFQDKDEQKKKITAKESPLMKGSSEMFFNTQNRNVAVNTKINKFSSDINKTVFLKIQQKSPTVPKGNLSKEPKNVKKDTVKAIKDSAEISINMNNFLDTEHSVFRDEDGNFDTVIKTGNEHLLRADDQYVNGRERERNTQEKNKWQNNCEKVTNKVTFHNSLIDKENACLTKQAKLHTNNFLDCPSVAHKYLSAVQKFDKSDSSFSTEKAFDARRSVASKIKYFSSEKHRLDAFDHESVASVLNKHGLSTSKNEIGLNISKANKDTKTTITGQLNTPQTAAESSPFMKTGIVYADCKDFFQQEEDSNDFKTLKSAESFQGICKLESKIEEREKHVFNEQESKSESDSMSKLDTLAKTEIKPRNIIVDLDVCENERKKKITLQKQKDISHLNKSSKQKWTTLINFQNENLREQPNLIFCKEETTNHENTEENDIQVQLLSGPNENHGTKKAKGCKMVSFKRKVGHTLKQNKSKHDTTVSTSNSPKGCTFQKVTSETKESSSIDKLSVLDERNICEPRPPKDVEDYLKNLQKKCIPTYTNSIATILEQNMQNLDNVETGYIAQQTQTDPTSMKKLYSESKTTVDFTSVVPSCSLSNSSEVKKQDVQTMAQETEKLSLWSFVDRYKVPIGMSVAAACVTVLMCKKRL